MKKDLNGGKGENKTDEKEGPQPTVKYCRIPSRGFDAPSLFTLFLGGREWRNDSGCRLALIFTC